MHVMSLLDGKSLWSGHLSDLFSWCKKWDQEFGFDMLEFYPEFAGLNETI